MCDQSGSLRAADDTASVGGNNLCSSSASSISSGIGQLRPATAARRTYSPTAVLPIPVASPTSRRLIPIACVRRSTSRIFFIDNLSAGIGFPLVARETDHLIRLSTGVLSTPPSPAVRNHRITVRVAPVSAGTMHRSKGLEFAAVGIVDLNDGLIPPRRALENAADPAIRRGVVDASKSLLHVSATRAKKRLFVSSSGVPSDLIVHLGA